MLKHFHGFLILSENGSDWFKGLSLTPTGGTKLLVLAESKNPGTWELPLGITVRELLEEHAGGMLARTQIQRCIARWSVYRLSY
jgi:NADH:ubiquinone oxidoreductase subunit F (NADH-binding)